MLRMASSLCVRFDGMDKLSHAAALVMALFRTIHQSRFLNRWLNRNTTLIIPSFYVTEGQPTRLSLLLDT